MKTQLTILTAILTTTLTTHAAAILDLGDLGGTLGEGAAYSVSADGSVVVGYSTATNDMPVAFRWTQSGGMTGLGDAPWELISCEARGSSGDGQVVVGSANAADGGHAFRWTAAGGMADLVGTSSPSNSTACAASSNGSVIVGTAMWETDTATAFRWTAGSGMVSLGDLPGGETDSGAYGVSADGSVVVGYGATTNGWEAFRWTATNGLESLGDLPGGEVDSWAEAVSADGQVIVGGSEATNSYEAFRWTRATGMVRLIGLAGFDDIAATSVSADGNTIVGYCSDSTGAQEMTAFVWTPAGGMAKLADFLTARGADLSHWQFLRHAYSINANGRWVCGYGITTNGTGRPFLADLGPSVTLQPVDDAYLISSGSQADETWNSTVLDQFGYYGAYKRPLLKFNLSSIPDGATILSARLTMALQGIYGGQGHSTTVWRMPNDNWHETNVTWNSYAQTGAVVVASLPGTGQLGDRVWHIQLADWPYAADLADDAVTFQTRWDTDGYGGWEGDGYYKANSYSSKEGTVPPTLRIEYTMGSATPRLSVTRSNNAVIVSWPLPADGWVLEATNTLPQVAAPWPQLSPPYQTNGANLQFTEPLPNGNRFYRLHKL